MSDVVRYLPAISRRKLALLKLTATIVMSFIGKTLIDMLYELCVV